MFGNRLRISAQRAIEPNLNYATMSRATDTVIKLDISRQKLLMYESVPLDYWI